MAFGMYKSNIYVTVLVTKCFQVKLKVVHSNNNNNNNQLYLGRVTRDSKN